MGPEFQAEEGAYAWRLSNPSVLLITCMRASLDLFEEAGGMEQLRKKSLLLTGYLELLLKQEIGSEHVQIFTPEDPAARGCQLSLSFPVVNTRVFVREYLSWVDVTHDSCLLSIYVFIYVCLYVCM